MKKFNVRNKVLTVRKKALSAIETALVIIVVAMTTYYIFSYAYDTYMRNTISNTINADAQSLLKGSLEWKEKSSNSDGTYLNINNTDLIVFLPEKMELKDSVIKSMGLEQGISYTVLSDRNVVSGDSLKIFIDLSKLKNSKKLSDRMIEFAETSAADTIKRVFGNNSSVVINKNATAIGAANASLSSGGTTTDGLVGVEKISL